MLLALLLCLVAIGLGQLGVLIYIAAHLRQQTLSLHSLNEPIGPHGPIA